MEIIQPDLIARDLATVWHPCSQMKDYEVLAPRPVVGAEGAWIELADGHRLIDASASWWSKSLGHGHPRLRTALKKQADQFEHVMFAHLTYDAIVRLSENLVALMPGLHKVSYAGDGSCALEMALKLSLHSRQVTGESKRTKFMALANSYHGETIGALSVSDLGIYSQPYKSMLADVSFIQNIPYVLNDRDPLWRDCSSVWPQIEAELERHSDELTAIVVEPILQAAAGMKIYSPDFLRRLSAWTKERGVHFIADEIMAGLGRTGKMLACEHANIQPDFVCLGKSLTSGWLPLSAVLMPNSIYDLFYADYDEGKNFLHSHTFSGNALGVAVANECLAVMKDENICARASAMQELLRVHMENIAQRTGKLHNVRALGAMAAADLIVDDASERKGFAVFQKAMELGALLRPLGNTLYWTPPLNINADDLDRLALITEQAILAV